ncbi:MAG: hypothetical protein K5864_01400 [Bacteroidales bacterium]|nr:hypothetical protein [Bacteroidales bacterium]
MVNLFTGNGIATMVVMLAISIFAGMLLGKLKVKGVSLGITWVLFVGIALGALMSTAGIDLVGQVVPEGKKFAGEHMNEHMLHFIKEFGLILFVTGVGIQVGPGFFKSFKKGGLALNGMVVVNVALGVLITYVIAKLANENLTDMTGVYTGAVTNTPGLSAAQQTVREIGPEGADRIMANGYAVAYPLAVVGMIVTCLIMKPIGKKRCDAVGENVDQDAPKATISSKGHKIKLVPIFIIIMLGVVVGSIPIPVGMQAPLKLGLAGGPLVVALIGSWLGVKRGWFTTEFTESQGVAMLREVGIALFLAAVGLGAGGSFIDTVQNGGYMWILYGLIITMVPPLLVGTFCRLVLKTEIYTLMGVIGGMHTDPPTLAFANNVAPEGSKQPNLGYATVYPLTMFLRIFTAQLLVLMAV